MSDATNQRLKKLQQSVDAVSGCVNDHDYICRCRPVDVRAALAKIERLRAALLSVAEQCACSCSGEWLVTAHTHHPDCRWYVAEEAREAAEAAGGEA